MLWRSGTELGILDELELQSNTKVIVKDAANQASETLPSKYVMPEGRARHGGV